MMTTDNIDNKITNDNKTIDETQRVPNKAFDSEYMTEWKREVEFLSSRGIYCTFVRRTPDYGIKQYKYRKTPTLFIALAEYYKMINDEKMFNNLRKKLAGSFTMPNEAEKAIVSTLSERGNNG